MSSPETSDDTEPSVVEGHVHDVVLDPDIMTSRLRHFVACHDFRFARRVPGKDVNPAAPARGLAFIAGRFRSPISERGLKRPVRAASSPAKM